MLRNIGLDRYRLAVEQEVYGAWPFPPAWPWDGFVPFRCIARFTVHTPGMSMDGAGGAA